MSRAEIYLAKAESCGRAAERTASSEIRAYWRQIGQSYLRLAAHEIAAGDQAERPEEAESGRLSGAR